MIDPYTPPESALGSGVETIQSKKAWKIFVWFLLFLEISSIIFMATDSETTLFEFISDVIVYSFILLGLFGFCYNKKFLFKQFWGYLIPVGIVYDIYSTVVAVYGEFETILELYIIISFSLVIGLPLLTLTYLALYNYRFKSDHIWANGLD